MPCRVCCPLLDGRGTHLFRKALSLTQNGCSFREWVCQQSLQRSNTDINNSKLSHKHQDLVDLVFYFSHYWKYCANPHPYSEHDSVSSPESQVPLFWGHTRLMSWFVNCYPLPMTQLLASNQSFKHFTERSQAPLSFKQHKKGKRRRQCSGAQLGRSEACWEEHHQEEKVGRTWKDLSSRCDRGCMNRVGRLPWRNTGNWTVRVLWPNDHAVNAQVMGTLPQGATALEWELLPKRAKGGGSSETGCWVCRGGHSQGGAPCTWAEKSPGLGAWAEQKDTHCI